MAVERRTLLRNADELRVHRQRLYRRAAPVFRQHGYREAPLKQLAAACGLSIPALYRYFPSKRDFALYPLSEANRPTRSCFSGAGDDPVVHLRLWLDHAAWERADFVVALRLGAELTEHGGLSAEHTRTFSFHIELVSGLLRATAPRLREQRARDLVESLLAMSFGAEAIGAQWAPPTARTRFLRLLLPDLIRTGAQSTHLAETFSAKPHPQHGPCSIEVASIGDFFDTTTRAVDRSADEDVTQES